MNPVQFVPQPSHYYVKSMTFKKSLFYYLIFIVPIYIVLILQSPLNTGADLIAHYSKSYSIAFNTENIKEVEFATSHIIPNSDPTDKSRTIESAFLVGENFSTAIHTLSSVNELGDGLKFDQNKTNTVPVAGAGAMVYPDILYYPNVIALKISNTLDYPIKSGIIMMRGFNLALFMMGVVFLLYLSNGLRPYVLLYLSIPTIIVQSMTGVVQGYTYLLMAIAIVLAINIIRQPQEVTNKVLFAFTSTLLTLYAPTTIAVIFLPIILQYFNNHKHQPIDFLMPITIMSIYFYWFLTTTSEVVILGSSSDSLSTLLTILSDPLVFIYKLIATYEQFGDWFLTSSFMSTYHHDATAATYTSYDLPFSFVVLTLIIYALLANQIRSNQSLPKGINIAFFYLIIGILLSTAVLIYIGYPLQTKDYIVGIHGRYHTSIFLPLFIMLSTIKLPKINIGSDLTIMLTISIYCIYLLIIDAFLSTTNSQIFQ